MTESVLIVGGGTMGAGIAALAASHGLHVEVVEPNADARVRLFERHPELTVLESVPSKIDASFVIEAIVEHLDLKRELFVALAATSSPQTILASNTSSLAIDEIMHPLADRSRTLGLHFFNPPHAMKLVEIVRAHDTSDETIARALDFVASLGKEAIVCADTPGFVVNRVARPYYLQSMLAYEAGVASFTEIDALARGVGFRMGPFELMDLIGIDINLATTESVYARTRAEHLAPVALQQRMVDAGTLGRKTGEGFFIYRDQAPERLEFSDVAEPLSQSVPIALLGFDMLAEEFAELLESHDIFPQRILNDDLCDEIHPDTMLIVDSGDGASDRTELLLMLESSIATDCVMLVDAYATDTQALRRRMRAPNRLVGYGVLGSLERQSVVEIVDTDDLDESALHVAKEFFARIGRHTVVVEDRPGLYLGRTVAAIVNEAVAAVHEGVAAADDVDRAMRLGTNYPIGPVAWGREIGGTRVARILYRLAQAYGSQYAPHRALWVLDIDPEGHESEIELGTPVL